MAGSDDVPKKKGRKHQMVRCSMDLDEVDSAGGKRRRAKKKGRKHLPMVRCSMNLDEVDSAGGKLGRAGVKDDQSNPKSSSPAQQKQSPAAAQIKELSMQQQDDSSSKEPRYVIISNGIAVFLLDLKQHDKEVQQPLTNADYVPPLPILSTLHLSAGLFKLGPHAYIIHGRRIRSLSLTSAATTTILTLSKPNNNMLLLPHKLNSKIPKNKTKQNKTKKKLITPQFWPITMEMDGQIHVINSAFGRFCSKPRPDYTFLHEIIIQQQQQRLVPSPPSGRLINSHLVLGTRIHATTLCNTYLIFDSHTCEWKEGDPQLFYDPRQLFYDRSFLCAGHVYNILDRGIGRCVGAYGEFYVVIGIGETYYPTHYYPPHCYYRENVDYGTLALAFLVNSKGEVVRTQRLYHFFQGPVQPYNMSTASLFKVDQTTWAAIINSGALVNGCEFDIAKDYLFIYTFSVQILVSAVESAYVNGCGRFGLEFVRLFPKGRFVYKTDADPFEALQACFI